MTGQEHPPGAIGEGPEPRPSPARRGMVPVVGVLIAIVALVGIALWMRSTADHDTTSTTTAPETAPGAEDSPEPIGTAAPAIPHETAPRPDPGTLERNLDEVDKQQEREQARAIPDDQEADPEELARYQRNLRRRLQAERADARQGDLLSPELVAYLRGIVQDLLSRPDGGEILATLREENPGPVPLEVNAPYPAESVATVPPALLERFPRLPKGIQYRFVGCNLILLAIDTELILDYAPECLW